MKGKTEVIKKPAKFKGYNNEFTTSTKRAQIQCNHTSLSSGSNSLDTQQKKFHRFPIKIKEKLNVLLNTFDAIIMGLYVCLNQLMFFDKILYWCKVFARIFGCEKRLDFSQPEV